MHAGGASNFHVPLISSVRNLTNDLSPCHALVTKSINGTVKFPPAFSDGTAVPAFVLEQLSCPAPRIEINRHHEIPSNCVTSYRQIVSRAGKRL